MFISIITEKAIYEFPPSTGITDLYIPSVIDIEIFTQVSFIKVMNLPQCAPEDLHEFVIIHRKTN